MIEAAAYLGCAILAGLSVFQLTLICGAPIGRFAWGGGHEVLPAKLRISSAISILLYAFFAAVLLAEADIAPITSARFTSVAIWIITAYFALGIFMNAISRSKPERMLMTPVALALTVIFLLVAIN